MKITVIPASNLTVFSTFNSAYKIPKEITIQSRDGDVSMLDELPENGLAIVGSRLPQQRSIEVLSEVIQELRNSKLIVISGFARGIDAKAHELAIQFGLRTIAILGCGIDRNYPVEHASLRKSILDAGGLVLSQFENQALPLSRNFYDRNGTIAGFSKAVWVVEAAAVSGTLNTANWAKELNRDLYATSCFPHDYHYQGNLKLLAQKNPNRFPIAQSLFNADSFGGTWTGLNNAGADQQKFKFAHDPKTEIQHWVLELEARTGECRIQALMDHATQKGYSLGKFYHLFEAEVEAGSLAHDSAGKVSLQS